MTLQPSNSEDKSGVFDIAVFEEFLRTDVDPLAAGSQAVVVAHDPIPAAADEPMDFATKLNNILALNEELQRLLKVVATWEVPPKKVYNHVINVINEIRKQGAFYASRCQSLQSAEDLEAAVQEFPISDFQYNLNGCLTGYHEVESIVSRIMDVGTVLKRTPSDAQEPRRPPKAVRFDLGRQAAAALSETTAAIEDGRVDGSASVDVH